MGIKLNAAKKLSIVEMGISRCSHFRNFLMFPKENSRSFLWKHEKDGTILPVLPQLYISYGMKRPIGENVLLPDTVRFICEANGYDAEKISQHFLEIPPKISPPEQR